MPEYKKGQQVEIIDTGQKGIVQQITTTHLSRGGDTETFVEYGIVLVESGESVVLRERDLKPVEESA